MSTGLYGENAVHRENRHRLNQLEAIHVASSTALALGASPFDIVRAAFGSDDLLPLLSSLIEDLEAEASMMRACTADEALL